jgi:Asp-tRNA(Asn)/Glu-tRNA(Gln) amidotransferase A subunit family amidase
MRKYIGAVSCSYHAGYRMALIKVDDPELYDGAHVAVQIIGRRFQEEKVLALTEILGDALGKHVV